MGKIELVNEKALKLNNPVMIDIQKCDFEKLNLIV